MSMWCARGRTLWLGALTVALLGPGVGACIFAPQPEPPADIGTGGSGNSGTATGTMTGTMTGTTSMTTGTSAGGSGAGANGQGAERPAVDGAPDAGPDAEFACEGLDTEHPVVLYLSADDSNSMASAAEARDHINNGWVPVGIRTYEILNYYRIGYPAAPTGHLSILPEMEAAATTGSYDLQIGVRSFDAIFPRRPITVTFVLDTSGSMAGTSIARERAAVKAIASALRAGDIVSIVTWNDGQNIVLAGHEVDGPNDEQVVAAANALSANGSTNLHNGLVTGYELATEHYGAARLNRVVLISDGGANTGITDQDLIALHSEDADQEGIYLVGIGTGPLGSYNDQLMDTVTDKGRGAYLYLDSEEEAYRMLRDRFDEVMEIAARGVQVELTLPWYFQMARFYGEEYSEDPTVIEPQHLAPSDAMVFSQVLRACDPSVVVPGDDVTIKATWQTPLTYQPREETTTITVEQLLAADKPFLPKGKAIVAYAEALKVATPESLQAALAMAVAANPAGTDRELNEIANLIQAHPSYE